MARSRPPCALIISAMKMRSKASLPFSPAFSACQYFLKCSLPVFVLLGPRMLGRLVAEPKYIDAFKHGLIETQRTGKPTTRLLDVIKHLGAQEGVKGLLTEPATPASDPTLNQRPNIFKRQPLPTSTAAAKPSGLTTE